VIANGAEAILKGLRRILIEAALIICAAACLSAQTAVPRFEDYPARDMHKGKNARLVLTRDDWSFRTRLRRAASEKPNFAGHYTLTTWGCGAPCVAGAMIDANTGRVYWLPFTVCCWADTDDSLRPVKYRLDSRLIVFSGVRNEEGENGTHFYVVKAGKFIYLRSVGKPKPAAGEKP
jgi:hypothetical protein